MEDSARTPAHFLSPDLPFVTNRHAEVLRRVRVVLVGPKYPGNIGSVARAMTVCGLTRMHLVNPVPSWRESDEAWTFACGSRSVLEQATEARNLEEALCGATTVIGTTHRMGRGRGPLLPPRKLAEHLPEMLSKGEVALVFGREDKGLSNDELALCQMGVHIPTASTYPSLNLSHAVMVVAYECFYAVVTTGDENVHVSGVSYPEIVALSERIAHLTARTGFRHRRGEVGFERSLRRAIERSSLSARDIALAHLVCRQVEQYIDRLEEQIRNERETSN
ncbi:MAG TPA: TrmJ/YjtD family RNA methyltransferase [Candidatus Latescibacteria bacterium]|nr:TrmJ/YjtD family RNA methyltransferase [Candidatus Latescibacterota bacterium]